MPKYDLTFTITIWVECPPSEIERLHDDVARDVFQAVDKALGGKPQYIRDCKTGRFRKL